MILLFCVLSYVQSRLRPRPNFDTYKTHKRTNGFDHRPINKKDPDLSTLRLFFEKKRTIDILQNPNVPVFEKMQIIDDGIMAPKTANIFAGGLMREWEFEMNQKKEL